MDYLTTHTSLSPIRRGFGPGFSDVTLWLDREKIYNPFLFAFYLNDLEKFFIQNDINSLEKVEILCADNLHIYIEIFALLYADDTIILAEIPESLQNALNSFENYCTRWKLKVNLNKT